MEILLTRYILEIMKDSTLFKLYDNGWYPNMDDYRRFIHKQEKNNLNFSKTLKRYSLIKKNDFIYEAIMNDNIDNVSKYFDNDSITLKLGYGTVHIDSSLALQSIDYSKFYISNGVYHNTLEIVKDILKNNGSFAVGVCDNPDSIFFKENKIRLKEIEAVLKKKKVPYIVCKHNNHRDKSYILAYRGDSK